MALRVAGALLAWSALFGATDAAAQNLYQGSNFAAMGADRRASEVGDILTVAIYQSAEASNSMQNGSSKSTNLGGSIDVANIHEGGEFKLGGGYSGRGEVRRTERFVTQMSVSVQQVLPNGDLLILGEQWMRVNGERTRIGVKGRVRAADIRSDNSVLSSRIADAQIDYDGRGFVSRSAKPGLINRLFSFLGLG